MSKFILPSCMKYKTKKMSYQERKTIANMASSMIILGAFAFYVYKYRIGDTPLNELALSFWAKSILWLIPAAIVGRIVFAILFAIINAIITQKPEKDFMDERDKLIELKSSRVTHFLFTAGFFVGITLIAFNQPYHYMFLAFVLGGFLSEQLGYVVQLHYYRKGF
ncbi:MAG: DUF2178 domain-containing protein [Bacteroidetes bacterium]|nr:DUF2178 domain-containing protein [Bacteroidota bacterium]